MDLALKDKKVLIYNRSLEFFLPASSWGYEVNGRTPVEWLVDQVKDYDPKSETIINLISDCISVTSHSLALIKQISEIEI